MRISMRNESAQSEESFKILIVDDDTSLLDSLRDSLQIDNSFSIDISNNPIVALEMLKIKNYDLLISDYQMVPINGDEFIKRVRKDNSYIYILLLTGYAEMAPPEQFFKELGIQGYCEKSYLSQVKLWVESSRVVCESNKRIDQMNASLRKTLNLENNLLQNQLNDNVKELERSHNELTKVYSYLKEDFKEEADNMQNLFVTLANLIECKDAYTEGHTRRVGDMCRKIGEKLGFDKQRLRDIEISGIIHDIGKVGISDTIINKPGKLTFDEFEEMKKHSIYGFEICSTVKALKNCVFAIRHHHEKLDGSGYPDGIKGDEISVEARIVAVVDIFDSLIYDRPYRKAMPVNVARDILVEESHMGHLDEKIVNILLELLKD